MPTINFDWSNTELTTAAAEQRVYLRQYWSTVDGQDNFEDPEWQLQRDIHCEQLSWALLPSIPTATLSLQYGLILRYYNPVSGNVTITPQELRGWYVRIETDFPDGTVSWYGFIDEVGYERGGFTGGRGARQNYDSGQQIFVCYGLEQVLAHWYTDQNFHFRQFETFGAFGDIGVIRRNNAAITFNDDDRPNRTGEKPRDVLGVTGDDSPITTHIFQAASPYNRVEQDPNNGAPNPEYWSSRDIVEYLVRFGAPEDAQGRRRIPFRVEGLNLIPDWDQPTLPTEGVSVLQMLQQLINANRLMQMATFVDTSTVPNQLVLQIRSLTDVDIDLPVSSPAAGGTAKHFANRRLINMTTQIPDVLVNIQQSTTSIVNQVVVRGGRRTSCFSTQIGEDIAGDNALIRSWTTDAESEVEQGASNEPGYLSLSLDEQRQRNKDVRDENRYRDVYRAFALWQDFAWTTDPAGGNVPIFPSDENPDEPYYPFWGMIQLTSLPFKQTVDYTQPGTDDDKVTGDFLDHLVWYEVYNAPQQRYMAADKLADSIFGNISISAGFSDNNQSLHLNVTGGEQYFHAATDHQPLVADEQFFDDYLKSFATINLQEDRFAEARFPPDSALDPNADMVRKHIIYAGETYREWLVAAETTVDLDSAGQFEPIDAGYLTAGDVFKSDGESLFALARLAGYWWLNPRSVLRLNSPRGTSQLFVGDLVTQVDGFDVGTVITQISYNNPRSQPGQQVQPPTYRLVTAMGENDALQFQPTDITRRQPVAPTPPAPRRQRRRTIL